MEQKQLKKNSFEGRGMSRSAKKFGRCRQRYLGTLKQEPMGVKTEKNEIEYQRNAQTNCKFREILICYKSNARQNTLN